MADGVAPGEVLSDRFELLEQVGRGGMGSVWRAKDTATGEIVAVKLLHGYFADNPAYRDRFAREVELARRVASPRIARVLGYGARDGVPFLVLEFVEGTTLADLIRTHGPYSWPETRTLLLAAARALADVHAADVIHRDVKPSNIMVTDDGRVKLTDFGIARALDLARLTGASTMLGTPAYLAPEGQRDERSDLYALGVVGFEVLVGQPPFAGDSTQGILLAHINTAPDLTRIPIEARPTIGWLLAKDPAERPQSANALVSALEGTTPVPTLRVPKAATASSGRSRAVLVAAGAVVVVVLLAGVAMASGIIGKGPSASPSAGVAGGQVALSPAVASLEPSAPSPSADASSVVQTAPPTAPPSAAAPTPMPPESPLPSAPGALLTIAVWPAELDGQAYPANWYANNGFLYSRGAAGNDALPILNPTNADYTVTARIQRLKSDNNFGIALRATNNGSYAVLFTPYSTFDGKVLDVHVFAPTGDTKLNAQPFVFDPAEWHVYTVGITGDTISVAIDGRLIGTTLDSQLTDPGSIAMVSDNAQIKVGALTVTSP